MTKWTQEYFEELRVQTTKRYWDLVYKEPDLTEPLLFPWQLERCAVDPIFREKLANMNENEIAEWNANQIKERDELFNETNI